MQKFLKRIDVLGRMPDMLMESFVKKVSNIEKDKTDNDFVTENVVSDTSLLVWKLASEAPSDPQHPILEAANKYIESIQEE